ncbi:Negative modulator of initiation of replication [Paraglaciecola sp. L3A3]|uniref:Negative modulator of initiation of replication n=1 Tax=Paraglaciecola sp. L3A3 TaxID=2686358 RepID=UPI00131E407A|nr:Negative modulator of initiation of replication [Paraglaciecola sp. L3A3]
MKSIEIDDDLYHFIAANTQHIGESASDILRRMVMPDSVKDKGSKRDLDNSNDKTIATSVISTELNDDVPCQANLVLEELQTMDLANIPKMVDRWLLALSVVHKHHNQSFAKVLGMSGRNRTYFAENKETLLETGSSTNPKNVPGSIYWVITNNNTVKKINMLKEVAHVVGFQDKEINRLVAIFAPEHMESL